MENLKLTSVRLSQSALYQAKVLRKTLGLWHTSDVLRVAIWIGLKFIQPRVVHAFMHMMWEEENNEVNYSAADVLRTAGEKLEILKSLE